MFSSLLGRYWHWIAALIALTLLANGLGLAIPMLVASTIDSYGAGSLRLERVATEFGAAAAGIFAFTCLQYVVQAYSSELVARDLRNRLVAKISAQDGAYVQEVGASRLLTHLTSDIESIKSFVTFVIVSIVAAAVLSVGAAALMFAIDWKLALCVVLVMLSIAALLVVVLKHVKGFAARVRASVDGLNAVINESIVGSPLIRMLNSHRAEQEKFLRVNLECLASALAINRPFAGLVPLITFGGTLATFVILALGGHSVTSGGMSLGDFAAFNSYVPMVFFPLLVAGVMSNAIAQASAAHRRIAAVLAAPVHRHHGTVVVRLRGDVRVRHLTLQLGRRRALDDVSFHVPAGSRIAILGPTAAGKTQLLYVLAGLVRQSSGEVLIDGVEIDRYDCSVRRQIGLVFQDGVMFNLTMRENICFSDSIDAARMEKALKTAELAKLCAALPDGLDTVVSERGTSLSGGQKQRIMLARALAMEPQILLLDDFTARVDVATEQRILANIRKGYPRMTLISVTQRIAPVADYDQIVLLMEGQALARGTHAELMRDSPEYVQIYNSQLSTDNYALRA